MPTASGFHRHRSVDVAEAAEHLGWVVEAVRAAGAEPVVHCCADDFPFDLLERGAPGVGLDVDRLTVEGYDGVAVALEAQRRVFLGVVPSTRPDPPHGPDVAERTRACSTMLGIEPTQRLVLTPSCGLAGADPAWLCEALTLCAAAAKHLDAG